MEISSARLLEIAGSALVRLDGAWFLTLSEQLGVEEAWRLDVEAWKRFSYTFAKLLRTEVISEPTWPQGYLDALEIFYRVMKVEGRSIAVEGERITVRVTDCETQRAIARAGVADCGIATVETYLGIARGLFGSAFDIEVRHTRNLNHGDDFCEVVIERQETQLPAKGR